ncbi:hypothetical protein BDE36_0778 [Arcticibacter tournemirensis]|uniref:Uncharacterized protein n=1 Tax=Arcticibacter tournemirensis TaxID=699437 RepID=A0A5M9H4K3_9SPHI|nr:hypothetical protein [Arcticibacter tournemirensis]KAA8481530.1 hypothetical protein F1649_14485 [Arcticibacter tournemirensis]TQM49086.1 hypothetical protein BDE36_0778 [Arcticibacter tournemirensis]
MRKRSVLILLLCWCGVLVAQTNTYLVEAESFQFKGGWFVERSGLCTGSAMLRVLGSKVGAADALTVIDVKEKGRYQIWVRSADYALQQGTRLFQMEVNNIAMEASGKHGHEGFFWEKAGELDLEAKPVLLRLKDIRKNYGRCDAIMLSSDPGVDPNEAKLFELAKFRVQPADMQATSAGTQAISPPLAVSPNAAVTAEISNEYLRLRFARAGAGNKSIAARTEIRTGDRWQALHAFNEDHKVFLISSAQPDFHYSNFFPAWGGSIARSYFTWNNKQVFLQQSDDLTNPFTAGNLSEAIPVSAEKVNESTIKVSYVTMDGSMVTGFWSLDKETRHFHVRLSCVTANAGYYSMGITAFQPVDSEKVANVLLPPMFQYKRVSPKPVMLTSSMMQQPLAIVESRLGEGFVSVFAAADADSFPLEWGNSDNARIGFSIKNVSNQIQATAFSPVLGLADSRMRQGDTLERSFIIGALPERWNAALEYVSNNVFHVRDYRTQSVSLTDAIFNMVDLVKNDDASGWDARLKGFYDIEANPAADPTVVQASPLSLLSTALITNDEDLFIKRALPAIEYTLSRSGYRSTAAAPDDNKTDRSQVFDPFRSQFTTAYFEGLHTLLAKANPWIKDVALPGNKIRDAAGYSVKIPDWVQELAAYKLTNDGKWLQSAREGADKFVKQQVYSNTRTPLGKGGFYNTSFYAYWWDLLDLYELTKDKQYLDGAEFSAFHTIAGIRSYPVVKNASQVIHPDGKYTGNTSLWWKGDRKYRLGFPRRPDDSPEKQVAQWTVSPVGLGFEQPFTYFEVGKTVRPVFMSSWAPHLLRLYQLTRRPIFNVYARNAVIGRFANYPGYYATGYTDIPMQSDFPYKGPDVSSIYYHHIPPHMAFSWDYLITEAIQRSCGRISFPYGKQEGFVWFTNHVFGQGAGEIFGDQQARLWMKRGLVSLDSPQINYITAISDNKFWVILLNESDKRIPVTVRVGDEAGILKNGTIKGYRNDQVKVFNMPIANAEATVETDGKSVLALAYPLKNSLASKPIPEVKQGMRVVDLGEPWGKLYMYRIRSTFGWDAIYGYVSSQKLTGATIDVSCNGQTVTRKSYPFEWSFHKIGMTGKAAVKIKLQAADRPEREEHIVFDVK